jgi:hypothetical protein
MKADTEITRVRQKMTAAYRAKLRLKQRFESIDFELDVMKPELKKLEIGLTAGLLPEFTIEFEESKPSKRVK